MIAVKGKQTERVRRTGREAHRGPHRRPQGLSDRVHGADALRRDHLERRIPGPRDPRGSGPTPTGVGPSRSSVQAVDRGLLDRPEPLRDEEFIPLRARPDFIDLDQGTDRSPTTGERMNRIGVSRAITLNVSCRFADLEDETGWNCLARSHSRTDGGERDMEVKSVLGALGLGLLLSSDGPRTGPRPARTPFPDITCAGPARCRGATSGRRAAHRVPAPAVPAPARVHPRSPPGGSAGRSLRGLGPGPPPAPGLGGLFPSAMAGSRGVAEAPGPTPCSSARALRPRRGCSAPASSGADRISR